MNQIHVLFFASVQERTGQRQIDLLVPDGSTVADLLQQLNQLFPRMSELTSALIISVNKEYADKDLRIPINAEVAIFPPVSGG